MTAARTDSMELYVRRTSSDVVTRAPALPGSPWRLAHEHAASIRLVMRAILRDLWRESRSLHAKSMLAGAA